jgi:hypothetical protein
MRKLRPLSGLLALAVLTACSDSGMLAPSDSPGGPSFKSVSALSIPAPADVVVPGVTAGSFANTIVADNSGRVTTEFWDNPSADQSSTTDNCNIGFFAAGTFSADCLNQAAGTLANQGGYSKYWGDGAEGRDPSAFMFAGAFEYNVTLKGSVAGKASEVGWFTKDGSGYHLNPVADWGNRVVNSALTINTGGADWGFYIKNTFNAATSGCVPDDTDCSDAEGGFDGAPFQQFALMVNASETSYLVGVEDNRLELYSNAPPLDSDYNDFIFSVDPQNVELLNGRMTGGGGKVTSAANEPVTYGFTLHCDITLSNNLEINWPGNQWHLDKPITLANCQDDPAIEPHPPVAPFDTFNGEGLGSLNGAPGSKVVFTLIDDGEGSKSGDKVALKVYAPDGVTVVLNVPLQLAPDGNIQAHYDQPHGQKP